MAATYTLSGNPKTLLGGEDFERVRAYVTCDQPILTDPDSGEVRIIGEADLILAVASTTEFSVDLPGNGWTPSPHFYVIHIEGRSRTTGINRLVTTQAFEMNADTTLAELPQAAPKAITVEDYESLIDARDEAVVARDQAVAIVAADAVPAIGASRGASTRWYKRIAVLDGVSETSGARISGVLAGNGDIGLQTFQDIYIRANQRGANQFTIQAQLRGFSDASVGTDLFYRQVSTYVFEIWARRPTFDAAIRFNMEGYDGSATAVMDTEQTSAPSGLVAVPITTLPATSEATYGKGISVNARNARDAGIVSGTADQGAAITSFLADALANQREAYFPRGSYVASQIVVPSKVSVRGSFLGGFGNSASEAGTFFKQAAGANKPFMVFTGTPSGSLIEIGPVRISDIVFTGDPANNASGHAIAFQGADGTLGKVQDTTLIERCLFRYWPQSGIYAPRGGRPFTVDLCNFLWNGEYGIDFQQITANLSQAVHFRDISGDGNLNGLVRCKGLDRHASITFSSTKSERRVNPLTSVAGQYDCLIFEDCADTAVTIQGLTHISSVPSGSVFEPPGAAIVVKGTGKPQISYRGVTVRVRSNDVAGAPATLRDDALTLGDGVTKFSVPVTAAAGQRDGFYGGTSGDYKWSELARLGNETMLDSGESTFPRTDAGVANGTSVGSGNLRGHFVTARKTEVITQVNIPCGSVPAAATPSLVRVGIYEEQSDGSATLIASSANDTTKLSVATQTDVATTLFPLSSSFAKIRGKRYAVALLVVSAATTPSVYTSSGLLGGIMSKTPRVAFNLSSQTDLPATISNTTLAGSGSTTRIYAELLP